MEPAGAPSAFDRQNITVSTGATISRTGTPNAAAALNMRAPSMCTFKPQLVRAVADLADRFAADKPCPRHVVRVLDFDRAGGA